MIHSIKILLAFATALIAFSACGEANHDETASMESNMCEKLPMQADGIVRLSKIQVKPAYLDEYMKYAVEVGTVSLETEPGVLTMYAVADKENPWSITILETYASQGAYKSHIASEHFRKYKQGTLHMVDSLLLDDVTPLNPDNVLIDIIKKD
ncbi:MAG: antibiotic biosynthesis monooxygenase [Muribaculaceae bacterium]|nr:antibiotic biosynthesis monooxygenase [Muribaculaceae bacterium]